MRNKKFATVFDDFAVSGLGQVHLTKDLGLVPMAMAENENSDPSIICYWCREQEIIKNPYKDKVKLVPIKAKFYFLYVIKLFFILFAEGVTCVNFYHLTKSTLLRSLLFNFFGFRVYLKLDMSDAGFSNLISKMEGVKNIKHLVFIKTLRSICCVSVENKNYYNILIKYPVFKNRLVYFPNSILKETIYAEPVHYTEREKLIIIVGRIGSYPKNHEYIVSSLQNIDNLCGWRFQFVGPIEDSFRRNIDQLFTARPDLKKSVEFVGNIDRETLCSLYAKARIFLMSSRWEGFSLAMLEAAYLGCYILSTNIGGFKALTNDGLYGSLINSADEQSLVNVLSQYFINDTMLHDQYEDRLKFVQDNFDIKSGAKEIESKIYGY